MGKLHEVLAVEQQLKAQATATRTDLAGTFRNKRHLFEEKLVTFQPLEEGVAPRTEEQSDIQSTIAKELDWIAGVWAKALDASYQIAAANTRAVADVVLEDGTTILRGVPATALLDWEKRVAEAIELVKAIPTLDPAKGFRPDLDRGEGIYRSRGVTKTRTKKTGRVVVLHPPTKEHPAQTQLVAEDVPTGTVTEVEWSGLLTPAQKGDMIERGEALQRAIKRAKSKANEVDVEDVRPVGAVLLRHIFVG